MAAMPARTASTAERRPFTRADYHAMGEAGIREVWLVDLRQDRIEAHSEPATGGYRRIRSHGPGESLAPWPAPSQFP